MNIEQEISRIKKAYLGGDLASPSPSTVDMKLLLIIVDLHKEIKKLRRELDTHMEVYHPTH